MSDWYSKHTKKDLADCIEALTAERDDLLTAKSNWNVRANDAENRAEAAEARIAKLERDKFAMRYERDTAKIAAANYADFNHTWRARAEAAEARVKVLADALLQVFAVSKDHTGHNLPQVTRLAQRIAAIARAALEGEK